MGTRIIVIAALALLMQGCASLAPTEAEQLSWNGPGAGPCLFGGVSNRAVEHCARVTLGEEAMLITINSQALAMLPEDAKCTDHVQAARELLKDYPDVQTRLIYSCPPGQADRSVCHVSVLATAADGRQYILDNGAAVPAAASHVASLDEFRHEVGQYWVDQPPNMAQAWGIDELLGEVDIAAEAAAKP